MSRWSVWSRGLEDKPRFLSNFVKEALDTGNPSVGSSPAERARQLGLQSDGSGGYIDPETGQKVAATVNGELVFYDNRGQGGGAVSDGSGGAELANAQPTWQDPATGMAITPPSRPESPEEQMAVPDPIPASAPAGYDSFMNQQRMRAYAQKNANNMQNNVDQAAATPHAAGTVQGINPIGPDGNVMGGSDIEGVQEGLGDNKELRDKSGILPKPGKTFQQMRQELQRSQGEQGPFTPQQDLQTRIDSRLSDKGGIQDQAEVSKKREQMLKPLQALANQEGTDPRVMHRLTSLGSRLYKDEIGGRKDKKLNQMNDEIIDGVIQNGDKVKEVFAPDPETGLPNVQAIAQHLEETKEFPDTPIEASKALWKSIPPEMRSNFGGQGKKGFDAFHDWVCRDGKCAMSGAWMHPDFINEDHQIPHSTTRNPGLSDEDRDYIKSTKNLWAIHKSLNQVMGEKEKGQTIDDIISEYGGDKRIEGLQDYLFSLNKEREEIHGNLPKMLEASLLDGDDDGKFLKEGVDMDGIDGAIEMGQHRQETIMQDIMDAFKSRFDPDDLIGNRKVPEESKAKKAKLQKAKKVIESIKGKGGIEPLFRALGIPTTFRADSQRGGSFTGMAPILRGVMGQIAGQPKEKQREIIKQWSEMLSASNKRAGSKWDEIHGDDTLAGLDKDGRLAKELEYKKEAARHVAQQAQEMGFLDMDSLEDGTDKKGLLELLNRDTLYEQNEESMINFQDDFDLRELLELLMGLMGDEGEQELTDTPF